MRVLLIRHADAESESPATLGDGGRALTPKGRKQAQDLAAWLLSQAAPPVLLLTSPLVRTVQTAEIVASLGQQGTVEVAGQLRPGQAVQALASLARSAQRPTALVGHEPMLGELGAALLERSSLPFAFEKGACLTIDLSGGAAAFISYRAPFGAPVTLLG